MLNKILENLKNNNQIECFELNNVCYTYGNLYQYVCNIYEYIIENNIDKTPVIVYGHKDIYMIASFLACSFAGTAYVPIDKSMTQDRKDEIIKEIKPQIIIDELMAEKIMKKSEYKDITKILMNDDDTYYIIYTSGSTGKPKGVKVTYKNLKSCVNWLMDICKVNEEIILNQANFSFDLSVADIYLSLNTKSKHYILDRESQKNYAVLFERLKKSRATFAVMTPSFAELLLIDKSFNKTMMPSLRKILFCGEKLTRGTVQKLYERFDDIEIINSYGPTECTFAVTSVVIDKNFIDEEIPIGISKKDVNLFIVDESFEEVDNEEGQIIISGESVSAGYVDLKLNDGKFIKYKGKNAYCTGDIGYFKNGMLFYKCRKDRQIKYKGYRIELSDIESTIMKLDYIENVIVTTIMGNFNKISKILAFISLKKDVEVKKIREDILEMLPDYMFPTIKIVNKFPLNLNGKIDEKKLVEEYLNGRKNN